MKITVWFRLSGILLCQEKHQKATVLRFPLCWHARAHFTNKIFNVLNFYKSYQKEISTAALEQWSTTA